MRARQRRRRWFQSLPKLRPSSSEHVSGFDITELTSNLENLLGKWREWIGGQPQHARQVLHKLVVERLTFTPNAEAAVPFYEFSGIEALEAVLTGILPPV